MAEIDYLEELLNRKMPEIDLSAIKKEAIAQAAAQPLPEKPALPANSYIGPGGTVIQRQEPIKIVGSTIDPRQYIQDADQNPPELEGQRESVNLLGNKILDDVNYTADKITDERARYGKHTDKLEAIADQYLKPVPAFKSQYEDMAKKIANEAKTETYKAPEEDMLTKAIYALGPGALGMLTGVDGMAAAAPAQKGAYDLRSQDRKEQLEAYKTKQNEGSKRQVALKLLMDSEQESFNKQQDQEGKRMGEASKILSGLSSEESKRLDSLINDRMELLKEDYQNERISQKDYYDNMMQLKGFQNQREIAEMMAGAGLTRVDMTNEAALKRQQEANSSAEKRAKEAAKAKVDAASIKKGSGHGGGKRLSIGAAENIASADTALSGLADVRAAVENNPEIFGKGQNILNKAAIATGIGDLATKAGSIDADLMTKAQIIGRYLEGGKLAEGDIKRYRKMLPETGDKPEIVQNKIAILERMLQQKYQADLASYKSSGYDTSKYGSKQVGPGITQGLNKQPQGFPRQLRKSGKVVTVKNDKELKEAQSEGWN